MVKNNLNPSWDPFRLSLHSLCSCDVHRPLKVKPQGNKGAASLLSETFPQEAAGFLPFPRVISTPLCGINNSSQLSVKFPWRSLYLRPYFLLKTELKSDVKQVDSG